MEADAGQGLGDSYAGAARSAAGAGKHGRQPLWVNRLHEVLVEASRLSSAAILGLPVSRQGNQIDIVGAVVGSKATSEFVPV